jgi:hypothetical protein
MKSKLLTSLLFLVGIMNSGLAQEAQQEVLQQESLQQDSTMPPRTLIIRVKTDQNGQETEARCWGVDFKQRVTDERLARAANHLINGIGQKEIDLTNAGDTQVPENMSMYFKLQDLIAMDPLEGAVNQSRASWSHWGGHSGFYGHGRGYYGYGNHNSYRHANYGYYWKNLFYPYRYNRYYYPYGGYNYYYYYNPYYNW